MSNNMAKSKNCKPEVSISATRMDLGPVTAMPLKNNLFTIKYKPEINPRGMSRKDK